MDFIETTPDRERAKSLMEMVEVRLDNIKLMREADTIRFASKITEEYYESLIELITSILCLDGYKTRSDITGAHINSINYMRRYRELGSHEIELIDDMRRKRAGVKYYGRHVDHDYLARRERDIMQVIVKLKSIVEKRL